MLKQKNALVKDGSPASSSSSPPLSLMVRSGAAGRAALFYYPEFLLNSNL